LLGEIVAVPAIAKSVYVCDDVIADPSSGKVSVLNVWQRVRVPSHETFPFCLKKLSTFVWWCGGRGMVRTNIDVRQASTGELIASTWPETEGLLAFARPDSSVYGVYRFEDVYFPEPGYYLVEAYCEGLFVDDLSVHVIHDTGAMP
jgi:hypothetical protein